MLLMQQSCTVLIMCSHPRAEAEAEAGPPVEKTNPNHFVTLWLRVPGSSSDL